MDSLDFTHVGNMRADRTPRKRQFSISTPMVHVLAILGRVVGVRFSVFRMETGKSLVLNRIPPTTVWS